MEGYMSSEVYKNLQKQLDQYSCGFPITASGVEFKILEKLFTEDEAKMFLCLSLKAETPEEVARRLGREPGPVASILHEMGEKGIVFRLQKDG
jgi:hypothetical protein